jgi:hypothetical protein
LSNLSNWPIIGKRITGVNLWENIQNVQISDGLGYEGLKKWREAKGSQTVAERKGERVALNKLEHGIILKQ